MLLSRLQNEEAILARLYATGRNDAIAKSVAQRIEKEIIKLRKEHGKTKAGPTKENTFSGFRGALHST